MRDESKRFLHNLLEAPSVSGYEPPAQKVVKDYIAPSADAVHVDSHGNLTAVINPDGSPTVMYAGHCDQIGFQILHFEKSGLMRFAGVGGHDRQVLLGQSVQVWTKDGVIPGVIARKPIHLLSQDERGKTPEMDKLWIDCGFKDKDEAKAAVRLGDPVTYTLGVTELRNGFFASPGLDDKVGSFACIEAARLLSERDDLSAAVHAVSTVQEEIGLRGARTSAYRIAPDVGIAVDVTFATDQPDVSAAKTGEVKMGGGPVIARGANINPIVFERLVEAAEAEDIPYQICPEPGGTGTDANAIQVSRGGVATGLVSIPNRYMHSPIEVCEYDDVMNVAKLLAAFTARLTPEVDFTPV